MDDFSRASGCFWLILVHMTCSLRVLEVIMFFGRDRLRAKEGVTCIRESNHHRKKGHINYAENDQRIATRRQARTCTLVVAVRNIRASVAPLPAPMAL